jgi:hypothetical protein
VNRRRAGRQRVRAVRAWRFRVRVRVLVRGRIAPAATTRASAGPANFPSNVGASICAGEVALRSPVETSSITVTRSRTVADTSARHAVPNGVRARWQDQEGRPAGGCVSRRPGTTTETARPPWFQRRGSDRVAEAAARNATTLNGISSLKLDRDPLGSPEPVRAAPGGGDVGNGSTRKMADASRVARSARVMWDDSTRAFLKLAGDGHA